MLVGLLQSLAIRFVMVCFFFNTISPFTAACCRKLLLSCISYLCTVYLAIFAEQQKYTCFCSCCYCYCSKHFSSHQIDAYDEKLQFFFQGFMFCSIFKEVLFFSEIVTRLSPCQQQGREYGTVRLIKYGTLHAVRIFWVRAVMGFKILRIGSFLNCAYY